MKIFSEKKTFGIGWVGRRNLCAKKLWHWVEGRKGGWVEVKAELRIAYRNQKAVLKIAYTIKNAIAFV